MDELELVTRRIKKYPPPLTVSADNDYNTNAKEGRKDMSPLSPVLEIRVEQTPRRPVSAPISFATPEFAADVDTEPRRPSVRSERKFSAKTRVTLTNQVTPFFYNNIKPECKYFTNFYASGYAHLNSKFRDSYMLSSRSFQAQLSLLLVFLWSLVVALQDDSLEEYVVLGLLFVVVCTLAVFVHKHYFKRSLELMSVICLLPLSCMFCKARWSVALFYVIFFYCSPIFHFLSATLCGWIVTIQVLASDSTESIDNWNSEICMRVMYNVLGMGLAYTVERAARLQYLAAYKLRMVMSRYQLIVEELEEPILVWDIHKNVFCINKPARALLGIEEALHDCIIPLHQLITNTSDRTELDHSRSSSCANISLNNYSQPNIDTDELGRTLTVVSAIHSDGFTVDVEMNVNEAYAGADSHTASDYIYIAYLKPLNNGDKRPDPVTTDTAPPARVHTYGEAKRYRSVKGYSRPSTSDERYSSRFQRLIADMHDAILVQNEHGTPLFVNRAYTTMWGFREGFLSLSGFADRKPSISSSRGSSGRNLIGSGRNSVSAESGLGSRRTSAGSSVYSGRKPSDQPFDIEGSIHIAHISSLERSRDLFEQWECTVERIKEIVRNGKTVINEELNLKDGRVLLRDFVPLYMDGKYEGWMWIYRDVTQQKNSEKARREAAVKARNEFLAFMCHEIRNPLNGSVGMTELLLDTPLTEEQFEYISSIKTSNDLMCAIVRDVLDLSKIEAGKMEIEMIHFDLVTLMLDVLRVSQVSAAKKNDSLKICCEIEPCLLELFDYDVGSMKKRPKKNVEPSAEPLIGDPTRLRQILLNFTSNALKFTTDGFVWLSATVEQERVDEIDVKLIVKDTGIGIEEDQMHKLFHTYSQANSSISRIFGGTGLGLWICKGLADCMMGKIGAKSQIAKGSEFFVIVPLKKSYSFSLLNDERVSKPTISFERAWSAEEEPLPCTEDVTDPKLAYASDASSPIPLPKRAASALDLSMPRTHLGIHSATNSPILRTGTSHRQHNRRHRVPLPNRSKTITNISIPKSNLLDMPVTRVSRANSTGGSAGGAASKYVALLQSYAAVPPPVPVPVPVPVTTVPTVSGAGDGAVEDNIPCCADRINVLLSEAQRGFSSHSSPASETLSPFLSEATDIISDTLSADEATGATVDVNIPSLKRASRTLQTLPSFSDKFLGATPFLRAPSLPPPAAVARAAGTGGGGVPFAQTLLRHSLSLSELASSPTFGVAVGVSDISSISFDRFIHLEHNGPATPCSSTTSSMDDSSTVASTLKRFSNSVDAILVVEDDKINQKYLSKMLTTMEYQVHIANNGLEAVQKMADCVYALVLMDMNMPVMTGYEAIVHVKQAGYPGPIVALTANATEDDRELCLRLGFHEFVTKPLKREMLNDLLKRWIPARVFSSDSLSSTSSPSYSLTTAGTAIEHLNILPNQEIAKLSTLPVAITASASSTTAAANGGVSAVPVTSNAAVSNTVAPPAGLEQLSVLVVEDDRINQKVLSKMLSTLRCEVRLAGNGLEALEMVEKHSFDLIVMDMNMPVMSGYETIVHLKAREYKGLMVALTANATHEDKHRCLELGFDQFMTKPVRKENLRELVERCFTKINSGNSVF